MLVAGLAVVAAAIGGAAAQRPSNTSICDYYTTALLKDNTAENQATLLTLVVNTAVIGNYTKPNVGIKVDGILAKGQYNGTDVNLAPYFSGGLASSNRGGSAGVAVNFLDDGGAAPLMKNMPAEGTDSNQYKLLTHLYTYFGVLLGCSQQGKSGFDAYTGAGSQYKVHKFMDLDAYEVGYFITQVGTSAASFGVTEDDVTAVGMALSSTFGYRCSPPATVVPSQGDQLQSICTAENCPLSPNATCSAEDNNGVGMEPKPANSTSNSTSSPTSSGSSASGSASSTGGSAPIETGSGAGMLTASISGLTAVVASLFALAL
ncbi:MAG: hypothetical protein M4579_000121 [Chaenotheca gracillima]|nr:MAG: hypothetical protein M4579_000121 [Chaenotheca gracillima]